VILQWFRQREHRVQGRTEGTQLGQLKVVDTGHVMHDAGPFRTLGSPQQPQCVRQADEQRVACGQPIARLGRPDENGGWTPHLHLQIICDMLGLGSDFPGVGTPSRRDVWRSISPDPNLLVGRRDVLSFFSWPRGTRHRPAESTGNEIRTAGTIIGTRWVVRATLFDRQRHGRRSD